MESIEKAWWWQLHKSYSSKLTHNSRQASNQMREAHLVCPPTFRVAGSAMMPSVWGPGINMRVSLEPRRGHVNNTGCSNRSCSTQWWRKTLQITWEDQWWVSAQVYSSHWTLEACLPQKFEIGYFLSHLTRDHRSQFGAARQEWPNAKVSFQILGLHLSHLGKCYKVGGVILRYPSDHVSKSCFKSESQKGIETQPFMIPLLSLVPLSSVPTH